MLFFVRYIERIVERAIICAALRPVEPTRGCYGSTSVWPGTLQIFFGLRERCTCCLCRPSKALFLFFIEISLCNEQLFALRCGLWSPHVVAMAPLASGPEHVVITWWVNGMFIVLLESTHSSSIFELFCLILAVFCFSCSENPMYLIKIAHFPPQ